MRKRHKYKTVQVTPEVDNLPSVKDIKNPLELPNRYVMFPDDLEQAVIRIETIEERLHRRKIRVIKPFNVFRYNGMLAFEVEKI